MPTTPSEVKDEIWNRKQNNKEANKMTIGEYQSPESKAALSGIYAPANIRPEWLREKIKVDLSGIYAPANIRPEGLREKIKNGLE